MTQPVYTCVKGSGTSGIAGQAFLDAAAFTRSVASDASNISSINLAQFGDGPVEVAPLTLQHVDLLDTFSTADRKDVGATTPMRGEHFADLGQGEPQSFALQNEGETVAVFMTEHAGGANPLRRQQAFALIKTQSPERDARIPGKFSDGNIV